MEYKNNSLIKEESISEFDKYLNGNNGLSSEMEYKPPSVLSQNHLKKYLAQIFPKPFH